MIDPWFLMEDQIMDEDFPHPMIIINSCTSEYVLPHLKLRQRNHRVCEGS